MLPSAKDYLVKGGMSPKKATLTLIGCFLVGALGISVLSSILHKYIPHTVVDCDHEHGDEEEGKIGDEHADHSNHLTQEQHGGLPRSDGVQEGQAHRSYGTSNEHSLPAQLARRPSLHAALSSKVTKLVTGNSKLCDETGHCYGYSDTCGTECFKNILQSRPPRLHSTKSTGNLKSARLSGLGRTQTTQSINERRPLLEDVDETSSRSRPATTENSVARQPSTNGHRSVEPNVPLQKHSRSSSTSSSRSSQHDSSGHGHSHSGAGPQHHHHVPTNIFLSIGLQTSTAIALHKIPEGFITYATNHANPKLGLSIFLALFIHNITEGFAMALPLYLAINSRWKAMFWSALLGGVSQPLGAGVAAMWFNLAGRSKGSGKGEPGDVVYGCMFAVTAGIMAMVSLQLLGESLDLTHSRRLCFVSAFAGMGILGLSSALTA